MLEGGGRKREREREKNIDFYNIKEIIARNRDEYLSKNTAVRSIHSHYVLLLNNKVGNIG